MTTFLTSKKHLLLALGFLKLSAGLAQVAPTATPTTSGKIPIDAARWYAQSNSPNNITALFDGSVTTGSITGWGKLIPSYDTYYTFQPGEAMSIESIRFYDGGSNNTGDPMTISVITNAGQRIAIGKYLGGHNYSWEGPNPSDLYNFKLPAPVSNIRALVITATWGYPTELELYGTYVAGTPLPTTDQTGVAVQKKIKLGQEMGVNGFEWNVENPASPSEVEASRLAAVKHFTGFRHYMDWSKVESTEGSFTYNPVHSGGWNYDVMYQRLKAEGVEVLACLQSMPDWMLASYPSADRDAEDVPVRYGRDFSDPNSYIEQARVAFQYVARYGANMNVNPALLRVDTSIRWFGDPANQIKIGLGYVKYIECGNERDKWWKGRKAYQTGFEYAANLSAFYDGNKNTMGAGVGVKNADPSIQVVMAGLASPNPDYVRGMIDWCRQNRGLKADGTVNLCWDVINYHLYSNDASTSQNGNSTRGSAPEVSNAGQVAQAFVKMAYQYANNMPVWVTETGYDLNQGSPLKAIAVGNRSVQQTEADWTLRTALLYARWGVERTFFYQLYDDNPTNPIQFGSSGLINSDFSARPAATFLRQANALLGSYVYTGTISSDPLVDRYEANGKTYYALVVPDEKGRTASYTLDLGTADSARIYQPQEGRTAMLASRVKTQGGKVTLNVTETPQFVMAGGGTATTTPTATACSGTGSIGWEQWTNVSGTGVAAIPVTTTATKTAVLTKLESAANIGDNYGARIRGYICPPQNGNYTFQIAGDDNCQLWLSTDDTPAAKVQLASISGWTNPGEWGKYSSQKSGTVSLVAGRRYYVEVLHKEGDGGDFVSVGWTLPDGTAELPIAGSRLMPFVAGSSLVKTATASATALVAGAKAESGATLLTDNLLDVYPNPFTNQTTVEFTLLAAGPAKLSVYDTRNQLVQLVYNGQAEAGVRKQFTLAGAGLPPGVYLLQLVTGSNVITKKLLRAD